MSGTHSFFCLFPTFFYSPINTNTYGTIATINRIARNAVYIGKRSSTFHEPDPSNPLPAYKRKDRKIYLELNVEQSDLWILVIVHFVDGSERWGTIRKANTAEAYSYREKDYYIDLVFYNYILKCFVLIDLKTNTVDYQDAGQMDMYVKMYDEKYRSESDNPTIGILLCADTDADVALLNVMHCNTMGLPAACAGADFEKAETSSYAPAFIESYSFC